MAETTKNDTVMYQDEAGDYEGAKGVVAFSPRSPVLALLADGDETGSWVDWPGGEGVFAVEGTWGGATASLEFSLDGGSTAIPAGSESELTAETTSDGAAHFAAAAEAQGIERVEALLPADHPYKSQRPLIDP